MLKHHMIVVIAIIWLALGTHVSNGQTSPANTGASMSIRDDIAFFMALPSGLDRVDSTTRERWKRLLQQGDSVVLVIDDMVVIPEEITADTVATVGRAAWILAAIGTAKADGVLVQWFSEADKSVDVATCRAEVSRASPQEVATGKARARALADDMQARILGHLEHRYAPALAEEVRAKLETYSVAVQINAVQYLLSIASRTAQPDVINFLKEKYGSDSSRLYRATWLANLLKEAESQKSTTTSKAAEKLRQTVSTASAASQVDTTETSGEQSERPGLRREIKEEAPASSWAAVAVWSAVAAIVAILAVIGMYYWPRK